MRKLSAARLPGILAVGLLAGSTAAGWASYGGCSTSS